METETTVAIMQPYFLPYLGYFQLIAKADVFVIYDDVSFIKSGWINRNRINIHGMQHTFTVPLQRASSNRLICDISICEGGAWRDRLLKSMRHAYVRAPQFAEIMPLVERIVTYPATNLSEYLLHSLSALCEHLELKTTIVASSRGYGNAHLKAQERVIDICHAERAHNYINPIGGAELYDRAQFADAGLTLKFLKPVLRPHADRRATFLPGLSIVDVLMHNDRRAVTELLAAGTLQ